LLQQQQQLKTCFKGTGARFRAGANKGSSSRYTLGR
jgi:hypothetical protein